MYGIYFNGKHSYRDLGITHGTVREIGVPNKIKVIKRPPFSNVDIDFSELYGDQVYEDRPLRYSFNLVDRNNKIEHISTTKTVLTNWLMNSNGKQRLYDDLYPNYYFLAEVEDAVDIEEDWTKGLLTVTFNAYPFMIHELKEGHDLWDEINFATDVLQPTKFDVSGTKEITLVNAGTPDVSPNIITDSPFSITLRGQKFNVSTRLTDSQRFVLKSGENRLKLEGNGRIEFIFYQELI